MISYILWAETIAQIVLAYYLVLRSIVLWREMNRDLDFQQRRTPVVEALVTSATFDAKMGFIRLRVALWYAVLSILGTISLSIHHPASPIISIAMRFALFYMCSEQTGIVTIELRRRQRLLDLLEAEAKKHA